MSGKNGTTRFVAASGLIAAIALSACGGGSGPDPSAEDAVKATVDAYNEALLSGDGREVCSNLTNKRQREMTDRGPRSCARAAAEFHKSILGPPSKLAVTVTQVWVRGDHARAHAVSTEPHQHGEVGYSLVKSGGAWKIDYVLGSS